MSMEPETLPLDSGVSMRSGRAGVSDQNSCSSSCLRSNLSFSGCDPRSPSSASVVCAFPSIALPLVAPLLRGKVRATAGRIQRPTEELLQFHLPR